MARKKKTDQEPEKLEQTQGVTPEPETEEQAKGADQEPEMPEQTQDAAKEPETAEQTEATAPECEDQDQEPPEQAKDATPEPDMFADLPNPCVYCGPSVKGVARQYTTYQGGISDVLREFIKAHPDALGLIVSTGKFPAMRKRLETQGTPEAKLYKAVKAGV